MRRRSALSSIVVLLSWGVISTPAAAEDVGDVLPDGESYAPAVSADGRYVAFVSEATNLLAGDPSSDPNGVADVFLVDTETGTIRPVSSAGAPADGSSTDVDISADGRYVVFETTATNIVTADANGPASDIVLFDALSGERTLVSRRGASGVQGDDESRAPTISADGTKIAFWSHATNLVANDTNAKPDIFVRDVVASVTKRVSTDSNGRQANGASNDGAMAPTGTHVALSSIATNLVDRDTNGKQDVFLKHLGSGRITRVSVTNGERQALGSSSLQDISADGRTVAFSSFAANLVKNDDNGKGDVFVRQRIDGTTVRVSRRGAIEANGDSFGAAISDEGAFVVFQSRATNLDVGADENGELDLFEYRVENKGLVRVSLDVTGGATDGTAYDATISGDGSVLAFASSATDLVMGDDDGVDDVFVHEWLDTARLERVVSWWSRVMPLG
ncbi:PD40 domain-containing protein [soil metagenome]